MTRFSANLGFLFKEMPFVERIRAAKATGFDAVEFHDQAQTADRTHLLTALEEMGLPVCSLNVRMGDTAGCAAIPGAEATFRADLAAAAESAVAVCAGAIHVLAGRTEDPRAWATFLANLRYALAETDRTILIEPICRAAMPGYFLHDLDQALAIVAEIGNPRLKILFDCYHIETEHGHCLARFESARDRVGHVQIASAPDRAEPDHGELDYGAFLSRAGWTHPVGLEFQPTTDVAATLARMRTMLARQS